MGFSLDVVEGRGDFVGSQITSFCTSISSQCVALANQTTHANRY